jgi:hypothetical protein
MRPFCLIGIVATREKLTARNRRGLEWDQRTRQPGLCPIQKDAHAKGFGALHRDQAHLPANVVTILKPRNLCFVVIGIPLKTLHAVLKSLAEPGTDFEAILQGGIVQHGRHLRRETRRKFLSFQPQVFPDATDITDKRLFHARLRCRGT